MWIGRLVEEADLKISLHINSHANMLKISERGRSIEIETNGFQKRPCIELGSSFIPIFDQIVGSVI